MASSDVVAHSAFDALRLGKSTQSLLLGCFVFLDSKTIKKQAKFMEIILLLRDEKGLLGIKVKVLLDWDPITKLGPMTPLHDLVIIHAPKGKDVNSAAAQVVTLAALLLKAPLTTVEYTDQVTFRS
ncbi:hypothetical protein Rs2_18126 [Raphanus sativus]|nr:hypothetical protein Rs2_18126 [Raphanus sativus]